MHRTAEQRCYWPVSSGADISRPTMKKSEESCRQDLIHFFGDKRKIVGIKNKNDPWRIHFGAAVLTKITLRSWQNRDLVRSDEQFVDEGIVIARYVIELTSKGQKLKKSKVLS
jgi:hypothetical protein